MEKSLIHLNSPIGSGGEASIYTVQSRPDLVAKIYKTPNSAYARKLAFMIANPPDDPLAAQKRVAIAWAVELVTDSGQVIGFLMPKLDLSKVKPIFHYYNPATRRRECPLFNYVYLLRTARNLARAFRSVHSQGYVIGDVNESNVLVAEDAIPTLVDTDSFQVNDGATIYRCTVGKPEYTPPELQNLSFRDVDRSIEHDLFGLGVLVFQLLMEGTHPFGGVFTGQGEAPEFIDRIKAGHFPHGNHRVPYRSMPHAPSFQILHPSLQQLFILCFEEGHSNPTARPTADIWSTALGEAENNLTKCSINEEHHYSNHLNYCPWCDRTAKLKGRDPFPSKAAIRSNPYPKPPEITRSNNKSPNSLLSNPLSTTISPTTQSPYTNSPKISYTPPKTSAIRGIGKTCLIILFFSFVFNVLSKLYKDSTGQSRQEDTSNTATTTVNSTSPQPLVYTPPPVILSEKEQALSKGWKYQEILLIVDKYNNVIRNFETKRPWVQVQWWFPNRQPNRDLDFHVNDSTEITETDVQQKLANKEYVYWSQLPPWNKTVICGSSRKSPRPGSAEYSQPSPPCDF